MNVDLMMALDETSEPVFMPIHPTVVEIFQSGPEAVDGADHRLHRIHSLLNPRGTQVSFRVECTTLWQKNKYCIMAIVKQVGGQGEGTE